jgi:hypothetical protein
MGLLGVYLVIVSVGLAISGLLMYFSSAADEEWEYGTCAGRKARRHLKEGNVQFILWHVGDQKEIDGVGHLTDKWHNFDPSWWPQFEPEHDAKEVEI